MAGSSSKRDFSLIVSLSKQFPYDNKETVKQILDMSQKSTALKTDMGWRYVGRLAKLLDGDFSNCNCVICGEKADNNVICARCIASTYEEVLEFEVAEETEAEAAGTEPAEEIQSGNETELVEEIQSGNETEPAEEIQSGNETEPAEEIQTGNETEPVEEIQSGNETEPVEEIQTENEIEPENSVEENSAEENPVEEAPAEENPVEEKQMDGTMVEQSTIEENGKPEEEAEENVELEISEEKSASPEIIEEAIEMVEEAVPEIVEEMGITSDEMETESIEEITVDENLAEEILVETSIKPEKPVEENVELEISEEKSALPEIIEAETIEETGIEENTVEENSEPVNPIVESVESEDTEEIKSVVENDSATVDTDDDLDNEDVETLLAELSEAAHEWKQENEVAFEPEKAVAETEKVIAEVSGESAKILYCGVCGNEIGANDPICRVCNKPRGTEGRFCVCCGNLKMQNVNYKNDSTEAVVVNSNVSTESNIQKPEKNADNVNELSTMPGDENERQIIVGGENDSDVQSILQELNSRDDAKESRKGSWKFLAIVIVAAVLVVFGKSMLNGGSTEAISYIGMSADDAFHEFGENSFEMLQSGDIMTNDDNKLGVTISNGIVYMISVDEQCEKNYKVMGVALGESEENIGKLVSAYSSETAYDSNTSTKGYVQNYFCVCNGYTVLVSYGIVDGKVSQVWAAIHN